MFGDSSGRKDEEHGEEQCQLDDKAEKCQRYAQVTSVQLEVQSATVSRPWTLN